jgi:hypothetical protein
MHGGTGILINDKLCELYSVQIIDKSLDGILGVKFTNKISKYVFIIFSCYLAPDNSPYGRNTAEYFGHLIAQLYIHSECDQIYFCGDFNGRLGNMKDVVVDIDTNIPTRNVIDPVITGHGETLVECLLDSRLCVLNGRFEPKYDNFTCISTKGKCVVDYIITPHDVFPKLQSFEVVTMNELCDICHLAPLLGTRSK